MESRPDCPTPKVTLLTWTKDPLETVFSVWEASKTEKPLRSTDEIARDVPRAEIEDLFRAVIAQRIPIGEHIDFVFMLENVSVSWREQAVRHRIGVNPSPERLGSDMVMVDKIPDLSDSSWWSQSMRIQNMGEFAERGAYRLPQTISEHKNKGLEHVYRNAMEEVETAYNHLVAAGIPMEDARELIPLGAHHRISWKLNIAALQHIIGKRGCWILQLGIWGPVIEGMINELATKVHPIFRELVTPPCIKGDDFKGCVFMEENRRRYSGEDALPPCPLHAYYHERPADDGISNAQDAVMALDIPMKKEMALRAEQYRGFWGRSPYHGARTPEGFRE